MPNPNPNPNPSRNRNRNRNRIPDDLICPLCNKKLSSKNTLSRHIRTHTDKRLECPYCEKLFSRTENYKIHVRIHTGEKPFPCLHPGCGKAFSCTRELTKHGAAHSEMRPFKCQHCEKSFKRRDHLSAHVQRVHNDIINQVVTTTNTETRPDGTTEAYTSHEFTATGITVYQLRSDTGSAMVTVAESPQATTTTVTQSLLPKPVTVAQSIPSADCLPIFPDIFQGLPDDLQQMSAKYDFDSDKAAAPDV